MSDAINIWEKPVTKELYIIAGWRQWADAGSISSGLPQYLVNQTNAKKIGSISPDGFYLFQIPGTHDLVRPVVKFEEGYPLSLEARRNELYYTGNSERGTLIFLGDEPHLDMERYVRLFLEVVKDLNVKRIISLGGVYGELPYNKERSVSCSYSLRSMKAELDDLAVGFSDYQGGASIGSYICRRAADMEREYVGLYAFAPTYDFSNISQIGNAIRIENDFMAWLGIMRRINHMTNLGFDLSDLEQKQERLIELVDAKVDELDAVSPQLDVREYMKRLEDEFDEVVFDPLDDVWADELKRLLDDEETE